MGSSSEFRSAPRPVPCRRGCRLGARPCSPGRRGTGPLACSHPALTVVAQIDPEPTRLGPSPIRVERGQILSNGARVELRVRPVDLVVSADTVVAARIRQYSIAHAAAHAANDSLSREPSFSPCYQQTAKNDDDCAERGRCIRNFVKKDDTNADADKQPDIVVRCEN